MTVLLRLTGVSLLAVFYIARVAAGGLTLVEVFGASWGLVIGALLIWLRFFPLLQLAALIGAVEIWDWPLLPALFLAAPRIFLVLPGLIATYLASRRHPRARWPVSV